MCSLTPSLLLLASLLSCMEPLLNLCLFAICSLYLCFARNSIPRTHSNCTCLPPARWPDRPCCWSACRVHFPPGTARVVLRSTSFLCTPTFGHSPSRTCSSVGGFPSPSPASPSRWVPSDLLSSQSLRSRTGTYLPQLPPTAAARTSDSMSQKHSRCLRCSHPVSPSTLHLIHKPCWRRCLHASLEVNGFGQDIWSSKPSTKKLFQGSWSSYPRSCLKTHIQMLPSLVHQGTRSYRKILATHCTDHTDYQTPWQVLLNPPMMSSWLVFFYSSYTTSEFSPFLVGINSFHSVLVSHFEASRYPECYQWVLASSHHLSCHRYDCLAFCFLPWGYSLELSESGECLPLQSQLESLAEYF